MIEKISKLRNTNSPIYLTVKLIAVVIVFFLTLFMLRLPYINIVGSIFQYVQYLIGLSVFMALFNTRKEWYLVLALFLFAVNYIPILLSKAATSEQMGVFSFFLIAAYLTLSLKDLRN